MAENMATIVEFINGVENLKKLLNKWGMALLGAAVTAGFVNGRLGEFVAAFLANVGH